MAIAERITIENTPLPDSLAEQLAIEHFLGRTAVRTVMLAEGINTHSLMNVDPQVMADVESLQKEGYDVKIVDTPPRHELAPHVQAAVDEEVAELGNLSNCADILFAPAVHPTGSNWFNLAKRAIALQTLYTAGNAKTLADGVTPEIFAEPMPAFGNMSAVERLKLKQGEQKATVIHQSYLAYTTTPMEENTGAFPSSKDFLVGVIDSRAVQTRADTAIKMARDRIVSKPERFADRGVVSASLACGAAGPVYDMAESLKKDDIPVERIILVDNDEMALACAMSLARDKGIEDKIDLQYQNLFSRHGSLTDYIEPHSVDFVDLLGLIDYVPTQLRIGLIQARPVEHFLKSVQQIMRPGGMILVGNMLDKRPQQPFFEKVWPASAMHQRSIREMLSIIKDAGYDPKTVQVRIPGREGVYANYGIPIPEAVESAKPRKLRLGRRVVQRLSNY